MTEPALSKKKATANFFDRALKVRKPSLGTVIGRALSIEVRGFLVSVRLSSKSDSLFRWSYPFGHLCFSPSGLIYTIDFECLRGANVDFVNAPMSGIERHITDALGVVVNNGKGGTATGGPRWGVREVGATTGEARVTVYVVDCVTKSRRACGCMEILQALIDNRIDTMISEVTSVARAAASAVLIVTATLALALSVLTATSAVARASATSSVLMRLSFARTAHD